MTKEPCPVFSNNSNSNNHWLQLLVRKIEEVDSTCPSNLCPQSRRYRWRNFNSTLLAEYDKNMEKKIMWRYFRPRYTSYEEKLRRMIRNIRKKSVFSWTKMLSLNHWGTARRKSSSLPKRNGTNSYSNKNCKNNTISFKSLTCKTFSWSSGRWSLLVTRTNLRMSANIIHLPPPRPRSRHQSTIFNILLVYSTRSQKFKIQRLLQKMIDPILNPLKRLPRWRKSTRSRYSGKKKLKTTTMGDVILWRKISIKSSRKKYINYIQYSHKQIVSAAIAISTITDL